MTAGLFFKDIIDSVDTLTLFADFLWKIKLYWGDIFCGCRVSGFWDQNILLLCQLPVSGGGVNLIIEMKTVWWRQSTTELSPSKATCYEQCPRAIEMPTSVWSRVWVGGKSGIAWLVIKLGNLEIIVWSPAYTLLISHLGTFEHYPLK